MRAGESEYIVSVCIAAASSLWGGLGGTSGGFGFAAGRWVEVTVDTLLLEVSRGGPAAGTGPP